MIINPLDNFDSELTELRKLVDLQAEDTALWFDAETAAEGYLQIHLRALHAMIEGLSDE